jgi:YVTN family beta-propeller protein
MLKFIICLAVQLKFGCLLSQQTYQKPKYDDNAIKQRNAPVLMPFNRLVQSAGKVITYGDSSLENHTLDFAILPDKKHIAIEHRYGLAILDVKNQSVTHRWSFENDSRFRGLMSTFSGIKCFSYDGHTYITWGASGRNNHKSSVMIAEWSEAGFREVSDIPISALAPAATALPNDISIQFEKNIPFLYIVLNGNNELLKIRFTDKQIVWSAATGVAPFGLCVINDKAYVTNWAGPLVIDSNFEHAGTPWGAAYTNPVTGGTSRGTLSVIDTQDGRLLNELPLGLHPNAVKSSPDGHYLYVANGNSDYISVINVVKEKITDSIFVGALSGKTPYYGSSPNALEIDQGGTTLYVANGLDNAICVVALGAVASSHGIGASVIKGYIPTEAYPGGLALLGNVLYVANIEAKGSRVLSPVKVLNEDDDAEAGIPTTAYTIHNELASISAIPVPGSDQLKQYTHKVQEQNQLFKLALADFSPRQNVVPRPVPERIGEPSVFKHVVYIIKENKTYDQVFGDIPEGRGMHKLCVYGDSVTPNQHRLAKIFSLMDNYYVSGKSSAEGHQWADAAMVSDYIEKNVRAWFRSYPHRQEDALVYNKNGFLWNNAMDHGKKVRIYGEACLTHYDKSLNWFSIYNAYLSHQDHGFVNTTTIARIRPVISPNYPDCDNLVFTDQLRAEIFINDWKRCEQEAGDNLADLMILSLPNDHTAGTSPGFPTPGAMVADNDLALGRIVDEITHSRFWDSTVIFVTEDDSQSGWDHISPYRTIGLVISPYSVLGKTIHTNYNQTSIVRTIEQILGIPPLNVIDATASPMFDCFTNKTEPYKNSLVPNKIPLTNMNKSLGELKGKALYYAKLSLNRAFKEVDGGEDDLMNKILWFDAKGNVGYPGAVK